MGRLSVSDRRACSFDVQIQNGQSHLCSDSKAEQNIYVASAALRLSRFLRDGFVGTTQKMRFRGSTLDDDQLDSKRLTEQVSVWKPWIFAIGRLAPRQRKRL